MTKRTTIVLDSDLLKKLRKIQANQIIKSSESVSLSSVVNQILEKGLK